MATRTQKQWLIGLGMIVTVVGTLVLLIAVTRPSDQPQAQPAISATSTAGALYALDSQLAEIGEYVPGASSNQVDVNVANNLAAFAKTQITELNTWGETNHIVLSQVGPSSKLKFAQDRGLLQTVISQRNGGLHTTLKIYLKRVQAAFTQVNLSEVAEEMRSRITDTENAVSTAVSDLG